MNPKKILVIGMLMITSGWGGYQLGLQNFRMSFKNWKPSIITSKLPTGTNKPQEADFAKFWTVWDKVSELYVDKEALNPQKMIDGATAGMVAALGDPYTAYLPAVQNKESKDDLGGTFEGVGIQLGFDNNNRLVVQTPLTDSPASRAGVKPGDLILKIKDIPAGVETTTDGMSLQQAVKLIRGKGGSRVTLTFAREGVEKAWDVELTRETIVVKSAEVKFVEKDNQNFAVITLSRFGDRTKEEWNTAVSEIKNKKDVKGVVLDLRNNPGGYLDGAIYIAGEFLAPGKMVVVQQYGDGTRIEGKVDRNGQLLNMPLTVLVNKGSASASEILSGALQDQRRAKIVGEQSFGKGSVQQPEDFSDGSGVHVTVAKWLRPSGEWIDKIGIKPDVEIKMAENNPKADPQMDKAIELLK